MGDSRGDDRRAARVDAHHRGRGGEGYARRSMNARSKESKLALGLLESIQLHLSSGELARQLWPCDAEPFVTFHRTFWNDMKNPYSLNVAPE